ncbi:tetratricopeptide repeat-containing sulfotransferase family protein [Fulvimonas yonginensis]
MTARRPGTQLTLAQDATPASIAPGVAMSEMEKNSKRPPTEFPASLLHRAESLARRGALSEASVLLRDAAEAWPGHDRVLRLQGIVSHQMGRFAEAAMAWSHLTRLFPQDASLHNNLGSALGASGDLSGAITAIRRACELAPEKPNYWYNLAKALASASHAREACTALMRLLELSPEDNEARLMLADCCKACGRLGQAEAELRTILHAEPASIEAWARLVGLKTATLTREDLAQLGQAHSHCPPDHPYRASLGFAYGAALEAAGRFEDAYRVIVDANRRKRTSVEWQADRISALADAQMRAFAGPVSEAEDPTLGREAILIFGMPRSGSTLVEQMLCAHPSVQAAGEVGDFSAVLTEESVRRGKPPAAWVSEASAQDWTRLGRSYLERMAGKHRGKPMFTDKELSKWQFVGIARSMLPGARFVYCERDPVETCWSCYKHEFERDQLYSYDLDELGRYWYDCTRTVGFWRDRFPDLIHAVVHEALLADPEREVRRLLAYCGLSFEPACLRFYEVERDVRTASAGQVRQPLMRQPGLAERYGPLFDPLRHALSAAQR